MRSQLRLRLYIEMCTENKILWEEHSPIHGHKNIDTFKTLTHMIYIKKQSCITLQRKIRNIL